MLEHGEDAEGGFGEDEVELFEPDPNYEPTEEGTQTKRVCLCDFCFCSFLTCCICFVPKRGTLIRRVPRHGVSRWWRVYSNCSRWINRTITLRMVYGLGCAWRINMLFWLGDTAILLGKSKWWVFQTAILRWKATQRY